MDKIVLIAGLLAILLMIKVAGHTSRFESAQEQFTADGYPCEQMNYYAQKYHLSENQREQLKAIGKCKTLK